MMAGEGVMDPREEHNVTTCTYHGRKRVKIYDWRDDPRVMTGRRWRPGYEKNVSTFPLSMVLYTVLYTATRFSRKTLGSAHNRARLHDGERRVSSHE